MSCFVSFFLEALTSFSSFLVSSKLAVTYLAMTFLVLARGSFLPHSVSFLLGSASHPSDRGEVHAVAQAGPTAPRSCRRTRSANPVLPWCGGCWRGSARRERLLSLELGPSPAP